MIEALRYMRGMEAPPVVIANHPSRSATGVGVYGKYTPSEFRNWNDTAPHVAIGMEGAPGHQAAAFNPDGSKDPKGTRGGYRNSPTMGGFDQMTARLGGLWDSMLGEGRRWWITSTSDSHRHWRDGGSDFWPGEYSKTYVLATHDHDDILDGLRDGRVFVTTGDLISELEVVARTPGTAGGQAMIGGNLEVGAGDDVQVSIRVRDPAGQNYGGGTPEVARVDLIVGDVSGPVSDRSADSNPTHAGGTSLHLRRLAQGRRVPDDDAHPAERRKDQLPARSRHQYRRTRAQFRSRGRRPVERSVVLREPDLSRSPVTLEPLVACAWRICRRRRAAISIQGTNRC